MDEPSAIYEIIDSILQEPSGERLSVVEMCHAGNIPVEYPEAVTMHGSRRHLNARHRRNRTGKTLISSSRHTNTVAMIKAQGPST